MRFLAILFILSITFSYGQELVTDLNGFRLGQYREVPQNEFNTMLQKERFDDGFEFEVFLIEKDTSAYMIFEYAYYDLKTIWSIQLTGTKKGFNCKFKGLKLGMSAKEIEKKLGAPSSIEDAGDSGKKWVYANTNYTLEVNHGGKLTGIKITDMSQEFFPETDLTKIPNFAQYTEILQSKDRQKISDLLAPGIKLYGSKSVRFFQNRISEEIKKDKSGIFKLVREFSDLLYKVNPDDSLQYEENMRLELGAAPMHVANFKVAGKTSEIVFKYMFGRYLIWEIKII